MIYTPKHFREGHTELIHDIIRRYNFATLVSLSGNSPVFSHLPFVLADNTKTLCAHMARANPQWKSFAPDHEVTVIFQGPHAYVSPRWYEPQAANVPTWNYAVVHAKGMPRIIHEEDAAFAAMQRLVQYHDPQWPLELAEKERRELLAQIVLFEIELTQLEAKFKLSQNRSARDRENVASELLRSKDPTDHALGGLMQRVASQSPLPNSAI